MGHVGVNSVNFESPHYLLHGISSDFHPVAVLADTIL